MWVSVFFNGYDAYRSLTLTFCKGVECNAELLEYMMRSETSKTNAGGRGREEMIGRFITYMIDRVTDSIQNWNSNGLAFDPLEAPQRPLLLGPYQQQMELNHLPALQLQQHHLAH